MKPKPTINLQNFRQRLPNQLSKSFSNPFSKHFATPINAMGRVGKTAKVAGKSVLRIAKGEKPSPQMLRESFEEMGTTYIKIGQFIASMPSVFPREYVEAFQGCLDQTTPLPFSYIKQVLNEELATNGKSLEDLFQHIEPAPLASASIAQVHAATLHDGTQVVLKVQKPEVKTIIETDLGMLHAVSKLLERIVPEVKIASLTPIIDEIRTQMSAETNFISEASNIADFHEFINNYNPANNRVTAPKVFHELTTQRVLTMSRLDGVSLIDANAVEQLGADPSAIMNTTLATWFASITQAKSFHADLHAGNLMLLKDGQVGFIDFGIVGRIKPESWQGCFNLMQGIQNQDYALIAESMVDIGMTQERDKINMSLLTADIANVVRMVKQNEAAINETMRQFDPTNLAGIKQPMNDISQLLLELVEVAKQHGIQFPRDFVLLIKQMLYFDRFLQVLAPDIGMFDNIQIER